METTLEKPQTEVQAEASPDPKSKAKISVLISSRKNSKYLAKFMHGLMTRTADIENVEILIMLNKNDTWNRELQAFYMALSLNIKGTIQFFEEDYKHGRDGLHEYFNDLAEYAIGDWLVYFCDDHWIEVSGWDEKIRQFAADRNIDSNKINFIIPKFDNAGSMNHIVSRGAYNAMGQMGRHGWIDSYLNDVMHRMDHEERIHKMDDELFHDFTHDRPEPMDPEHTKSEISEEVKTWPKHNSAEYVDLANQDANKLKDLIARGVL